MKSGSHARIDDDDDDDDDNKPVNTCNDNEAFNMPIQSRPSNKTVEGTGSGEGESERKRLGSSRCVRVTSLVER